MKRASAILLPVLLALAGCLSPPLPEELVDVDRPAAPEPLLPQEMTRLSRVGISEEVVLELVRTRGVADRRETRTPKPTIVYRELFIPLWPVYGGGRWHVGCRIGIFCRTVEEEPSPPPEPQPDFVDP